MTSLKSRKALSLVVSANFYWTLPTCCSPTTFTCLCASFTIPWRTGLWMRTPKFWRSYISYLKLKCNQYRNLIQVQVDLTQKLHGSFHYIITPWFSLQPVAILATTTTTILVISPPYPWNYRSKPLTSK